MFHKGEKKPIFHTYFANFGRIRFFLENPSRSLFRIHRDLSSCQKPENCNEPILWKSPRQKDGHKDGRGQIYGTLPHR